MTEAEPTTLEAELGDEDAAREIAKAVSARHSIARKYVKWVRRRHPDATPAEVIQMIERHYSTAISAAGAAVVAGSIAADVGIGLIPVAGAAAAGVKSAGRQAAKSAAKEVALGAAKVGAHRGVALLPAGDAQLQFEITAVFGLALADIHGMNLDREQARALVYGLSNGLVSPQLIATMAKDVAKESTVGVVGVGKNIAAGREDWSHWANTLADALPGGAAQSLVRTIKTGQLDTIRESLGGKHKVAIEYGIGAVVGGVTRFVFGRDVVEASRAAFNDAPEAFPAHLAEIEPSRAFVALKQAAKTKGSWVADTAGKVGGGVAIAATTATRPFRSVDIDGDGIPDEPQAFTVAKSVGGVIVGAAGAVGERAAGLAKPKKRR